MPARLVSCNVTKSASGQGMQGIRRGHETYTLSEVLEWLAVFRPTVCRLVVSSTSAVAMGGQDIYLPHIAISRCHSKSKILVGAVTPLIQPAPYLHITCKCLTANTDIRILTVSVTIRNTHFSTCREACATTSKASCDLHAWTSSLCMHLLLYLTAASK